MQLSIEENVSTLTRRINDLRFEEKQLTGALTKTRRKQARRGALLAFWRSALRCRNELQSRGVWLWGVFVIGVAASSALAFFLTLTADSVFVSFLGLLLGACAGVTMFGVFLFVPQTHQLQQNVVVLENEAAGGDSAVREFAARLPWVRETLSTSIAQHRQLSRELARIEQLRSVEHRRRQLFLQNWRAMRSIEFEEYLKLVFEALGDVVETTKVSGDQGVDLLVRRRGRRIAVQVKGYFNSVGNSAVQEAYAGMGFQDCDVCAVITNSRFTRSARELAEKLGCVLIDEDSMEDFVMGRFDF